MAITRKVVLWCGICFAVGVALSAIITYQSVPRGTEQQQNMDESENNDQQYLTQGADEKIMQKLMMEIKAENIREYLRHLTEHPHLAGTPADADQAEELKGFWKDLGLKSWITPYKVLLSYPDSDNPNRIELQDGSGRELFTTQLVEKILRPEQNQSDVVPPFNAFSATGQPQGPLVYVNYGRVEDFMWLSKNKSINFTGKICIARYGKIFRGNKGVNAEKFGASGLILYTDPKDNALPGSEKVYPDSWWLPSTGVQRGNVRRTAISGDQLTPDYPATDCEPPAFSKSTSNFPIYMLKPKFKRKIPEVGESAYRISEEAADLPRIPIHPISYGDALRLLQNMTGDDAPVDWQGDLPITYRLGPGFKENEWRVQMFISTDNKMVTTYNAFGMIKGAIEPDRYVMFGNHRDAWVFGALDPSSGTAAMMELSRAVAKMVKNGWRPRRSILFCSWAAEEYGLVGSTEWVQQYGKIYSNRIVSYINIDTAVIGGFTFSPASSPIAKEVLYDVAKVIPNPDSDEVRLGHKMLYDTWKLRAFYKDARGEPRVPILGSGSDFAPFIDQQGVTCIDLTYIHDQSLGVWSYPLYHSVYETFHLVNEFIDPTFVFHRAIAQYGGELLRRLSDNYLLPYDVRTYGTALGQYKDNLQMRLNERPDIKEKLDTALDYLDKAVGLFVQSADDFHKRLMQVNKDNPVEVRMINDQIMSVGRSFINHQGLPYRPLIRNVLFAPSMHNNYAGSSFPGVVDTLYEAEQVSKEDDDDVDVFEQKLEQVKKQMSIVTFCVEAAATVLLEYDRIKV